MMDHGPIPPFPTKIRIQFYVNRSNGSFVSTHQFINQTITNKYHRQGVNCNLMVNNME